MSALVYLQQSLGLIFGVQMCWFASKQNYVDFLKIFKRECFGKGLSRLVIRLAAFIKSSLYACVKRRFSFGNSNLH